MSKKRLLSVVLVLAMCLGMLPTWAMAEGGEKTLTFDSSAGYQIDSKAVTEVTVNSGETLTLNNNAWNAFVLKMHNHKIAITVKQGGTVIATLDNAKTMTIAGTGAAVFKMAGEENSTLFIKSQGPTADSSVGTQFTVEVGETADVTVDVTSFSSDATAMTMINNILSGKLINNGKLTLIGTGFAINPNAGFGGDPFYPANTEQKITNNGTLTVGNGTTVTVLEGATISGAGAIELAGSGKVMVAKSADLDALIKPAETESGKTVTYKDGKYQLTSTTAAADANDKHVGVYKVTGGVGNTTISLPATPKFAILPQDEWYKDLTGEQRAFYTEEFGGTGNSAHLFGEFGKVHDDTDKYYIVDVDVSALVAGMGDDDYLHLKLTNPAYALVETNDDLSGETKGNGSDYHTYVPTKDQQSGDYVKYGVYKKSVLASDNTISVIVPAEDGKTVTMAMYVDNKGYDSSASSDAAKGYGHYEAPAQGVVTYTINSAEKGASAEIAPEITSAGATITGYDKNTMEWTRWTGSEMTAWSSKDLPTDVKVSGDIFEFRYQNMSKVTRITTSAVVEQHTMTLNTIANATLSTGANDGALEQSGAYGEDIKAVTFTANAGYYFDVNDNDFKKTVAALDEMYLAVVVNTEDTTTKCNGITISGKFYADNTGKEITLPAVKAKETVTVNPVVGATQNDGKATVTGLTAAMEYAKLNLEEAEGETEEEKKADAAENVTTWTAGAADLSLAAGTYAVRVPLTPTTNASDGYTYFTVAAYNEEEATVTFTLTDTAGAKVTNATVTLASAADPDANPALEAAEVTLTHAGDGVYTGTVNLSRTWTYEITAENHVTVENGDLDENKTAHAVTLTRFYTVSFDDNDGNADTSIDSKQVNHNAKATAPTEPTRTGYRFDGWYTAAEFAKIGTEETATAFDFTNTAITADVALKANWVQVGVVTFAIDKTKGAASNATAPAAQTIDVGNKATAPTAPAAADGWAFLGWYEADEFAKLNTENHATATKFNFETEITAEGVTLTAGYAKRFTVTLNNFFGGVDVDPITNVPYGTAVKDIEGTVGTETVKGLPTPTTKSTTNTMFDGWYKTYTNGNFTDKVADTDTITADVTYYAKWSQGTEITFDMNGFDGLDNMTQTVSFGGTIDEEKLIEAISAKVTKDTKVFGGWYKTKGTNTDELSSPVDLSDSYFGGFTRLYAKWLDWNKVTFKSNTPASSTTTPNEDVVNYFLPTGYDVNYLSTELATLTKATAPADFENDHNKFAGWYTAATEGTKVTTAQIEALTTSATYYAHWTPCVMVTFQIKAAEAPDPAVTYPAKLTPTGGYVSDAQLAAANAEAAKAEKQRNDDMTFGGWYTDSGCTTAFDKTVKITDNTTLYAKWVAKITVTLKDGDDDTRIATVDVPVGSKLSDLDESIRVPNKAGNSFSAWYTTRATGGALSGKYNIDTPITGNRTLYAKWLDDAVTLTINGGDNGILTVTDKDGKTVANNAVVTAGEKFTVTATPNYGYKLKTLTYDADTATNTATEDTADPESKLDATKANNTQTFTFTMPDTPAAVAATFEQLTGTASVTINLKKGDDAVNATSTIELTNQNGVKAPDAAFNNASSASVTLVEGAYTYSFTLPGYQSVYGSFTVSGTNAKTVDIPLTAKSTETGATDEKATITAVTTTDNAVTSEESFDTAENVAAATAAATAAKTAEPDQVEPLVISSNISTDAANVESTLTIGATVLGALKNEDTNQALAGVKIESGAGTANLSANVVSQLIKGNDDVAVTIAKADATAEDTETVKNATASTADSAAVEAEKSDITNGYREVAKTFSADALVGSTPLTELNGLVELTFELDAATLKKDPKIYYNNNGNLVVLKKITDDDMPDNNTYKVSGDKLTIYTEHFSEWMLITDVSPVHIEIVRTGGNVVCDTLQDAFDQAKTGETIMIGASVLNKANSGTKLTAKFTDGAATLVIITDQDGEALADTSVLEIRNKVGKVLEPLGTGAAITSTYADDTGIYEGKTVIYVETGIDGLTAVYTPAASIELKPTVQLTSTALLPVSEPTAVTLKFYYRDGSTEKVSFELSYNSTSQKFEARLAENSTPANTEAFNARSIDATGVLANTGKPAFDKTSSGTTFDNTTGALTVKILNANAEGTYYLYYTSSKEYGVGNSAVMTSLEPIQISGDTLTKTIMMTKGLKALEYKIFNKKVDITKVDEVTNSENIVDSIMLVNVAE